MRKRVRISAELAGWDWKMVVEALDNYMAEHMEEIDCSELLAFVQHIESRVEDGL
ncbi:hypothetical protein PBI_PEREGRIN_124 [Rhodococcus phage Peregrin]|jgi:hypothetical protein|nr:hypothetical protein PBI_PEREGRIN_124 [Rhodococcus phage Peregrin]